MVCYNIYVFNRQGVCVFYHEWYRPQTAKQGAGSLAGDHKQMFGFIWTMSNLCVALDPKDPNKQQLGTPRKAGHGCRFHSATTSAYKMHFLETPTGFKVVLNTATDMGDLSRWLQALFDEVVVERVVRSPAYVPGQPFPFPEELAQALSVWLRQRNLLQAPQQSVPAGALPLA